MRQHGWHHGRGYDPMAKGIEGWRVEAISGGMAGAIEAMAECIIPGIKGGIMAGGIMAIMVALWEGRNQPDKCLWQLKWRWKKILLEGKGIVEGLNWLTKR